MNIFVTDTNPIIAAQALDDKRLNKMILESAQLLCTATDQGPYKSFQPNSRFVVWLRANPANLRWLQTHAEAMAIEYTRRFGKVHKSHTNALMKIKIEEKNWMKASEFVNAAANKSKGFDFTNIANVCEAYQQYLNARWASDKRKPVWTNAKPPTWCTYISQ